MNPVQYFFSGCTTGALIVFVGIFIGYIPLPKIVPVVPIPKEVMASPEQVNTFSQGPHTPQNQWGK